MIPVLYKANETDFSHLGLGVLTDTLRAEVTEERNGVFELEVDYPVDGLLFNALKNDRLIRVDASPKLKDQRFRIVHMEKKTNQIMTVFAEHVSYLSQDLALNPTVNYSGNAQSALNTWSSNIVDSHPFTTFSDISHSASGRWEIEDVENARRALGGVRGSLLDSYGGEYRFDNYHIQLWQDRGRDSGVLIAYGKNLVDLEQEEEITSTYTSIYPYSIAEDEEGNQGERITLPELFIDSEHVDKYARRKILVVDFSQDEVKTVEALRNRAEQYIEANNIGVPKVNIRVQFQDLAKTVDYADLELVEEINLCDTVDVYYEKLDIQTNAKIIKVVWNVLLDEYTELEIGDARSSLSQTVNNIVDGKVDEVDRRVNRVQIAANGKNRIFRGADEPTQGMSLNDLWYKPVGEGETELYRWNGNIWTLEKVSAGLLGGTLDAENGDVNLINVNVANIVGETSEFVRSAWNGAAGGGVTVDGSGVRSIASNGAESLVQNGVFLSREPGGATLGYIGFDQTGLSPFFTQTVALGANFRIRANRGGSLFDNLFEVFPGSNETYLRTENTRVTGSLYAGDGITVQNGSDVVMNGSGSIIGPYGLYLANGGSILSLSTDSTMRISSNQRLSLRTNGTDTALSFDSTYGYMYRTLSMEGNSITNQSDIRLKTNVTDATVDALEEIERMRFIDFEWDKSMAINERKPDGRHFSIEAQYSPFLQTQTSTEESYLSIDMNKQIMLNSKAIQELYTMIKGRFDE